MRKKLTSKQKKIDANKDGKITGKDFAMLRKKKPTKKSKPKLPTRNSRRRKAMTKRRK
jgi:hypothetical protein